MIDLHVHSTFSDGSDNIEEIVKKANELDLTHLSITDHNKCDAYLNSNKHLLDDFKGKIITGTEISTYFDGQVIHVLAYNFDPKPVSKFLKKYFKDFNKINREELKIIGKTLDRLGIYHNKPSKEDINNNVWSTKYYYPYVISKENIEKYFNGKTPTMNNIFWKNFSNKNSPFFCDFKKLRPDIKKVIGVVKKSGGKCIVAHSNLYGKYFVDKFDILKDLGIDGFECYYPTYTNEYREMIVNYCKQNNLLMSVGSDYHGNRRQNQMGFGIDNNLCKDYSIIENWKI